MSESWALSVDGEFYQGDYPSKEDALAAANDEFDEPKTVFVGRAIPWIPRIYGPWVADHLSDQTYDDVLAEVVGDWPKLSQQEEDSLGAHLTAALHTWLHEHGQWPTFFTVTDAEELAVPPSDV